MSHPAQDPVPVVVGVDVATAAVRVVCVDAAGRVLAEAGSPLPAPVRGPGGTSEQDASSWWPATAGALRRATSALPGLGREVRAVAVSATSGTLVPADAAGAPLGPALMYDDRRAADLNSLAQQAGSARWARLGLTVGPTAALGRIAWCVRAYGASSVRQVLHTPDLLGLRLTGAPVPADWSHALKSGYDARAGEWAGEVFDALGVPAGLLARVAAPGTESGTVCASAAAETGLPVGCSVRLGMTDGCAGQLATGAVSPGQFVGVLGTTYVLKGVARELPLDPTGALYSHRHPDGWWLPGGASNTGGEALAATDPARLPTLDAAAAGRGPASCVSYPLRRDGERFPFVSGDARGFLLGSPTDDVDRHRADLEGVAFLERLALERVSALGVEVSGPLYAAGGGSRSALWNRIRASVLDRPLRIVARAETAFGAALLAASGTLHPDLTSAAAAMTGAAEEVAPVKAEQAALEASYDRFRTELAARGWL
ncbi:FGGY-family carbohydrate kinase [Streptomyces sp. VRA16 Mangrove soil]|uniref:FGGY-family carbohydrate kinase n=1 Tax=Streptomyces sp. VRA16 Mangrove soil TaxID=2817434 RepID=UPI001A9D1975|nr:FGGY family carbohydrate kinase [Streptomyces sp. VRA16 Mangrove soil]MBO1330647.1 carbohydrate kinase [Streptomyces sp. VRA16 Mangrove soil]